MHECTCTDASFALNTDDMMKLVCAPMATISHQAFRWCVEQFQGCDEFFGEMINAGTLVSGGPFERYYLQNDIEPQKTVWQLTGNNASTIAQAAAIVARQGGIGVDINMGCSAPQVVRTGAGVAWMARPLSEVAECARKTREALDGVEQQVGRSLRLSVKCRLGGEGYTQQSLFAFADALISGGVTLITLHPRTQKERYRGLPRYDVAQALAVHCKGRAAVYVNGCIRDGETAEQVAAACPSAAGLMIARGAAERPWVFAQIKRARQGEGVREAIRVDRLAVALGFIDALERWQPREFHKTRIQRFFGYYCSQFFFAHYFRTRMQNFTSLAASRDELLSYFEKQPHERIIEI